MKKPRLLCVIPHAPALDSCLPLLARLQERGRIDTLCLIGKRLLRIEPRVAAMVQTSPVPIRPVSVLRLEVLSLWDIARASAILTHSDPLAYGGKFRPRDTYIRRLNKPVIFVQHGMVQSGLHLAGGKTGWDFHAGLLLLWAPLPDPAAPFLARPLTDRLVVTGLIKRDQRGLSASHAALQASLAPYRQRVLICHNFGFESARYHGAAQEAAFRLWSDLAAARPDTVFLIRPHRGRLHPDFDQAMAALAARHPNVIRSERHGGLTRMATIDDLLRVVDRVITHPSTVILDSVYAGTPVAVFGAPGPDPDGLDQADDIAGALGFLDHPSPRGAEALRRRYGDIDASLDRAAEAVERHLAPPRA